LIPEINAIDEVLIGASVQRGEESNDVVKVDEETKGVHGVKASVILEKFVLENVRVDHGDSNWRQKYAATCWGANVVDFVSLCRYGIKNTPKNVLTNGSLKVLSDPVSDGSDLHLGVKPA